MFDPTVYSLVLLNNSIGVALNASCLDGSPGAFYFKPASDPAHKNHWQIFFEGGGWCYTEKQCVSRAKTVLGSSLNYTATMDDQKGILSSNCTINPAFCHFNKVYLKYCDGNSFSGLRDSPLQTSSGGLHFRGRAIIDAVLETLIEDYHLGDAEQVHLLGCSAGGLATFLHTNAVGDYLYAHAKNLTRFKSSPVSGFFLLHSNVLGVDVYPNEMASIFDLSNATAGLDPECIRTQSPGSKWQCNFAEVTYRFIRYPVFLLDSSLDSFQTNCILAADEIGGCGGMGGWTQCVNNPGKANCNATLAFAITGYQSDFMTHLSTVDTFYRSGNGAFITSCHAHCAGTSDAAYTTHAVAGRTMQRALADWWAADPAEDPTKHTFYPCVRTNLGNDCNPTCM